MRLTDYWGVGPKTAALLEAELGHEAAIGAIEAADVGALASAGLPRGRATAILRRARGREGLGVLATADARAVYRDLVDIAAGHAVTGHAADRVRVLTPLRDPAAMEARLDRVVAAVDAWSALDDADRRAVLAAFEAYDAAGGTEAAAVDAALAIRSAGAVNGPFAPFADLDAPALDAAAAGLRALDGDGVRAGADDELDDRRAALDAVERLERDALDLLESVRSSGARDMAEFREAFAERVIRETGLPGSTVRGAMPAEAVDAADFVGGTLRALAAEARSSVADREAAILAEAGAAVDAARDGVDAAVGAVEDLALDLSLARFAAAYDLVRPTIPPDRDVLAVEGARNLPLEAAGGDVQPVSYAVGDHDLDGVPAGDRVAVLTGANSGGKTTLLETCCAVAILAMMGLPVPAERAVVGPTEAVVFHRRHASFNAGVLESTLRTIVPPLAGKGRTLVLVDEFEAITEPGRAADLLHGLVTLTVEREAVGVFVTHLADDLAPLPAAARVDGIVAEGLTRDLALVVDYQPRFGTVGRSTPELIVSRLVAEADDPAARAGFEALARALGQPVIQRTLADARWGGTPGSETG